MLLNRCCIVLILLLFGANVAKSQEQALTESYEEKIYFREAYRYVESSYHNNATALENIKSIIEIAQKKDTLISIEIQAWACPKGGVKYNTTLAQNRAKELTKWITSNCNITKDKIKISSGGIGWGILRNLVATSDAPYKESVIDIIDNTSMYVTDSSGNIITGKRKKLMEHNYGRTWRDMETRFFPEIRCGLAVIVNIKRQERVITYNADVTPVIENQTAIAAPPSTVNTSLEMPLSSHATHKYAAIALKTNLLFDVATLLNVEVEVPLHRRWSIAGEWIFPWWLCEKKQRCIEVLAGTIEGRYWLGKSDTSPTRNNLEGWFVGLYAGGGLYDLEWNRKGYQGEFFIATGISAGYVHKLSRDWRIEFSAGIGLLKTDYREYEAMYSTIDSKWHLIWQRDGTYKWLGPTKAKISLVWYPHLFREKKGGRQ